MKLKIVRKTDGLTQLSLATSRLSGKSMAVSGNISHSGTNGNCQQTQFPTVLALQQVSSQPQPQDATQAMIELFHTHDIVMLGEIHGNQQEYEWLCNLVRTPEVADSVDGIVVEFGNSLYQQTVDRYISGEDVPFEQVQKAWRNMIASVPPVSPAYGWFYQAVREANMERHSRHRMRLLMDSPPGDRDKIKNSSDLAPYENGGEGWYAQVVKREVLGKASPRIADHGNGTFSPRICWADPRRLLVTAAWCYARHREVSNSTELY